MIFQAKNMFFLDRIARDMISSPIEDGRMLDTVPEILSYPVSEYVELQEIVTLIFPITSILLGIHLIKRAISTGTGTIPQRITCIVFGCIATLGLGILAFAIQMLYVGVMEVIYRCASRR